MTSTPAMTNMAKNGCLWLAATTLARTTLGYTDYIAALIRFLPELNTVVDWFCLTCGSLVFGCEPLA